jgi:hypothetical protein
MFRLFLEYSYFFIFLPGLIGLFRWKQMDKKFHPFVMLIWVGCLNEVISTIVVAQGHTNIINNNIYFLLEAFFLLWFFEKNGLFKDQRMLLAGIATAYLTLFLFESLTLKKFTMQNNYFLVLYAFVTVLMSISTINYLLVNTKSNLLTNGVFLICIAFIVFFTQTVLVHSFWIYGLTNSRNFLATIYLIMFYVNLFANLTFAVGLLWIPKKQPSLLPF